MSFFNKVLFFGKKKGSFWIIENLTNIAIFGENFTTYLVSQN
jgi:hypothetical protein